MEQHTPMKRAVTRIIDECGATALANELGCPHPSTVTNWKHRGAIPSDQIPKVIEAARRLGKTYTPNDFFDLDAA